MCHQFSAYVCLKKIAGDPPVSIDDDSDYRRMGNCLKSPGGANDDISLLRDSNTNNSNSVEQLEQPPSYIQVSTSFSSQENLGISIVHGA